MKMRDYITLGWDQLRRRMVVTVLCVLGLAIGSSSIVVALSFGESITHYASNQFNSFLKLDEISVQGLPSQSSTPGQEGSHALTKQKIDLIRTLPHVESAAMFGRVDYVQFTVDDSKNGMFQLMETDLSMLSKFGYELHQGAVSDQENTIIVSFSSMFDLYDERLAQALAQQGRTPSYSYERPKPIAYPLYQKQLILTWTSGDERSAVKTVEFPVRVVGVLSKPEGVSDYSVGYNKMAFISHELADRIRDMQSSDVVMYGEDQELKVRVDDPDHVAKVENLIQKLQLSTRSNIHYQEQTNTEFMIIRLILGGAGFFVLCIASISIIVAMTMSTYQRRRQIGIMKVLGANLNQIRNMFIVESALLGVIGGAFGILFAYWVIWGINIVVTRLAQSEEILFISLWILPVGMFFALMTGILSGIYPAIKASRTDALTAINRE